MSKQPSGMIIGQKGVQYGLQKVGPKKTGLAGAQQTQRKAAPTNVFGDDDSEEEDVERQIARQADKKRAAAKVQQMYEEALAADPSVFDYDGVYDSIQEAREAPKQQDKVQRQSKYIASLLEQAQQRKREQDVLYERRMVKEREQEDHLYEGKERFVTSAYRKKLEEDKKWQEAERQRELEEQRNDVRKVGHMGNFYANLLTKNVAYGTALHSDDKQQPQQEQEDRCEREREKEEKEKGRPGTAAAAAGAGGSSREGTPDGPSAKVLSQLDRYDKLRLEAERAMQRQPRQQQPHQEQETEHQQGPDREEGRGPQAVTRDVATRGAAADAEREVAGASPAGRESGAQRSGGAGDGSGTTGASAEAAPGGGVSGGGPGPAVAGAGGGGKRRNDDNAVISARERYLARKQQKTG